MENDTSHTIRDSINRKVTKTSKYKNLKNYKWGVGIEHEMHLFHNPFSDKTKTKKQKLKFTVFDSEIPTREIINNFKNIKGVKIKDVETLKNVPFEASGRKCSKQFVMEKIPIYMPEFITTDPFSTLKNKKTMEMYIEELIIQEKSFIKLMNKHDITRQQTKKYGKLTSFPFGMAGNIKVPTEKSRLTNTYKYMNKLYEDYTGSYHVTLTLPFDTTKQKSKSYEKKFIDMHKNFANQFQWIEPLLLTAFFSSDLRAIGTEEKRVRGSFRIMRTGWGNLAGTDVRKLDKGVGRYSDIKTYWREKLTDFKDIEKLKYCDNVTIKEPGAISALSSNIRTFGSTDPDRPWHRESGVGMTIPNGIEIRIFDNFSSIFLISLCRIIVYLAENSTKHIATKYVYNNKVWITALEQIMKEGWRARLSVDYVNTLRAQLGLKIKFPKCKTKNAYYAFTVMAIINEELFNKNKNGNIPYLMLYEQYETAPYIPSINKLSWEYGFLIKLKNEPKLYNKFNKLFKKIITKPLYRPDFNKLFYSMFPRKKWESDIVDIIHLMFDYKIASSNNDAHIYITNKSLTNFSMENINIKLELPWDHYITSDGLNSTQLQNGMNTEIFKYDDIHSNDNDNNDNSN
jgi:hypothetical protein